MDVNMAILTDCHCHTNISIDGSDTMLAMARAEHAAGVNILCFTDHCNTVDWHTLQFYPPCGTVAQRVCAAYDACRDALPEGLDVRLGMELGETIFHPELAAELSAAPGLDFILGSLHITPEQGDFHNIRYESYEQCSALCLLYLEKLQLIADAGCFDAMAHIGYIRRYMWQNGFDAGLTLEKHGDAIETLLRTIIAKGKGIEINCSGIRDGCGPFPSPEILRLYRDLGGEIITVGSDAHRTADAAKCIAEGHELLRSLGFRYVSVYRRHEPEFYPL